MDMKRRQLSPKCTNQAILVISFSSIFLSFLVISVIYQNPQSEQGSSKTRVFKDETEIGGEDSSSPHHSSSKFVDNDGSFESTAKHKDKLLDGILAPDFDEQSCLSRYEANFYRKISPHKPSPYLISRFRKYEALHKKCGPYTEPYNNSIKKLKASQNINRPAAADCNYVVWIPFDGLGNKILTLASAFLYALLTNRVLLVDRGADMVDLFCEPFPETSWFLPLDFPVNQFDNLHEESPQCYGHLVRNNLINGSIGEVPPFLYQNLAHGYNKYDKLFFCEEDQKFIQKVPWLMIRSNYYFVPSLFLISSFEQELSHLFPLKETVFHHLGRYLIHPTNIVWSMVKRYYEAYLDKADERLGIQIRIFKSVKGRFPYSLEQIRGCYLKEKLLPEVSNQEPISSLFQDQKSIAVLVTSLNSTYSKSLRNMYWEYPTVTGEIIGIYQPSNEQQQQSEKLDHNRKALSEIFLLSMTDKLITSGMSTFGYVAQGLGGLKPWILTKPKTSTLPTPHCQPAISMEPCFQSPPYYDCKLKIGRDDSKVISQVKHCEDTNWGVKLIDNDS